MGMLVKAWNAAAKSLVLVKELCVFVCVCARLGEGCMGIVVGTLTRLGSCFSRPRGLIFIPSKVGVPTIKKEVLGRKAMPSS